MSFLHLSSRKNTTNTSSATPRKRHRKLRLVHKWGGLFFTLFLIVFSISGIILNHRQGLSHVDVPRSILPPSYRMAHWNLGSVRGTLRLSPDSVLLFGENGLWLTDATHRHFSPFDRGIKPGADNHLVNNVVRTRSGNIVAVTPFDAYLWDNRQQAWQNITPRFLPSDRMTDAATRGDTIVLQSRSELFLATPPYQHFQRIHLKAPTNATLGRMSFRTVWMLHSGELFGLLGQLFVDFIGIVVILLAITGVVLAFFPRLLRQQRRRQTIITKSSSLLHNLLRRIFRGSLQLHNKLGVYLLGFLLLLTVTGMCLRPPLLIALATHKHQPIAFTHEDNPNPWWDNLRMIRYDRFHDTWLFQTPFGFFTTPDLRTAPSRVNHEPPVGFMGTNVLVQEDADTWVAGSFSGLYRWNVRTGESLNLYTGRPYVAPTHQGIPDFTYSVSGYSTDLGTRPVVFDYNRGAEYALPSSATHYAPAHWGEMPKHVREGRLSLWRVALETHTGRIYTFLPNIIVQLFIFLSGVFLLTILISGYVIWRKFHHFAKSR